MGAVIIIIVLTAIAEMLSGLGRSSNSQRDAVIAQNFATREIANLLAQGESTDNFPPSDASSTPSVLAGAVLTANSTTAYGGINFYTYVVGGFCTLSTATSGGTTLGNWVSYTSSSNTPAEGDPAVYIAAVIMTWGKSPGTSNTITISATDNVTTTAPHLLLTSIIPMPTGYTPPSPSTTASVCPAVLL